LITRADDFGASPGTNDAIFECLDAGFVRNVGVMVPGPFFRHRLEELVERQDGFCLGLHATLNSEWANLRWGPVLPTSSVSSLVEPDGTFHRSVMTLHDCGVAAEMIREVEAQLSQARDLGLRPRYLDTHMGFSWISGVAGALAALCEREGLIFANGPSFADLNLSLGDQPTPDQIRDAIRNLTKSHAGSHPVWVFHPAKRDAFSERFFPNASEPSSAVADARHLEYETLSNGPLMAGWIARGNILPCTYYLTD
jgi:predicted glycoside hydrolase/deacetylase ChbG (UPF0249 family)